MRRWMLALALGAGCEDCDPEPPTALSPFRDDWVTEVDLPFPYGSAADPGITDLAIGGLVHEHNFANHGDVIVSFTGPPGRITIEMRRFTMAASRDEADAQMAGMSLWAYATDGSSPAPPSQMDEADDCTQGAWKDGCAVRFYYDGLHQLERAGADFRVTLPADYRHEVSIVTDDADADDLYVNRGNVCLENVDASVAVTLHSGIALATLAEGITPAPACAEADLQACIAAGWATGCGCDTFGGLRIETDGSGTADITVDVPASLWSYINAENTGPMQNLDEEYCKADITVPGVVYQAPRDPAKPWQAKAAEVNDPGEQAFAGAGYGIHLESAGCGAAARTEDPEDFVGEGDGDEQEDGERGNIAVCTNCLRGAGVCDRLDELAQHGGAPPEGL